MQIIEALTEELKVQKWQVEAAVGLIDEGNTIPFISRYRKEATGSLNDEQLRKLHERLQYLRNLEEKKNQVLSSIEEQGKLTEELRKQIEKAQTLVVVEDLYRPYRPKRRTRATIAREKGLEGLAALKMPGTFCVSDGVRQIVQEAGSKGDNRRDHSGGQYHADDGDQGSGAVLEHGFQGNSGKNIHGRITSSFTIRPSSSIRIRSAVSAIFSSWVMTIRVCLYFRLE